MRHATRNRRLSLPSEQRKALLNGLVKNLVKHGQINTTLTRAKEAQRLADRLVTYGKEGSIHARRQAFRVLQDRFLVKQLFAEIAPRFTDVNGGYTRVVRSRIRPGDGAQLALLAFSRMPAIEAPTTTREAEPAKAAETAQKAETEEAEQPKKGLLEGLRDRFSRRTKE